MKIYEFILSLRSSFPFVCSQTFMTSTENIFHLNTKLHYISIHKVSRDLNLTHSHIPAFSHSFRKSNNMHIVSTKAKCFMPVFMMNSKMGNLPPPYFYCMIKYFMHFQGFKDFGIK